MLLSPGPRDPKTPRTVEEHDFEQAAANIRPSWAELPAPGRSGPIATQARASHDPRVSHDPWSAGQPLASPAVASWPAPPGNSASDEDNPFAPRRKGLRWKGWLALLGLGCLGVGVVWLEDEPSSAPAAAPIAPRAREGKQPTAAQPAPALSTTPTLPSTAGQPMRGALTAPAEQQPAPPSQSGAAAERTATNANQAVSSRPGASKPAALATAGRSTADSKGVGTRAVTGSKLGPTARPGAIAKPNATAKLGPMAKPAPSPKPGAIAKPAATSKPGAAAKPPAVTKPASKAPTNAKPPAHQVMRDLPVAPAPAAAPRSLSNQFAPRRPAGEAIRSNPYE